jgi:hypothetical protein
MNSIVHLILSIILAIVIFVNFIYSKKIHFEYYAGNVSIYSTPNLKPITPNSNVYNCEFGAPLYIDWCNLA